MEPAALASLEYLLGRRPAPGSVLREEGTRGRLAGGTGAPQDGRAAGRAADGPAGYGREREEGEGRYRAALAAWFRLPARTRGLIAELWPAEDPLAPWLRDYALAAPPGSVAGEAGAGAAGETGCQAAREAAAAAQPVAAGYEAPPDPPAQDVPAAGAGAGEADRDGATPRVPSPGNAGDGRGPGTGRSWQDAMEEIFAPGGPLSRLLPGYRPRPGQLRMARAVAGALAEGRHLAVEAGTGIGKTLAYLVPAVLWARHHDRRVVVATHTIALQEQLRTRDLPLLHRLLPFPFDSAVLKGFSHYACRLQADATFRALTGPGARPDAVTRRVAARVAAWLEQTATGDASELDDPAASALWSRFSVEPGACLGAACPMARQCFPLQARERAQSADLVVTNHALLVADRASEHRVLPEYDAVIVDEAHHLEDVAVQQLGVRIRPGDLARYLAATAAGAGSPAGPAHRLPAGGLPADAAEEAGEAAAALRETDAALRRWLGGQQRPEEQAVARLPAGWRESAAGRDLATALERAAGALQALLQRLALGPVPPGEAAFLAARRLRQRLQAAAEAVERCLQAEGWCLWIEAGERGEPELAAAPVDASGLLAPWFEQTIAVFTSATLPRGDHWLKRLGVPDASRLEIPSPYDYRRQALLAVATDAPRPPARPGAAYLDDLAARVCAVADVVPGGILVLFTARTVLSEVARRVRAPLAQRGRRLAVQDEDGPRGALVAALREGTIDVLFGLDSLWEGIDVPGDRLQAVIVTRLPFDPPSDPLTAARCEALEAAGGSAFFQYQLPRAEVRLRQGFGRLVRGDQDRGVVVVFDPRLAPAGSRYARRLLDALPPATRVAGPTAAIIEAIQTWFRGST
ncbi:MAG TPA: helicase C-terminal domain-containing protein [Thermaerobacter sp.]